MKQVMTASASACLCRPAAQGVHGIGSESGPEYCRCTPTRNLCVTGTGNFLAVGWHAKSETCGFIPRDYMMPLEEHPDPLRPGMYARPLEKGCHSCVGAHARIRYQAYRRVSHADFSAQDGCIWADGCLHGLSDGPLNTCHWRSYPRVIYPGS
jgi:hypothetical protein